MVTDGISVAALARVMDSIEPEEAEMAEAWLETFVRDPDAAKHGGPGAGARFGGADAGIADAVFQAIDFLLPFMSAVAVKSVEIVGFLAQVGGTASAAVAVARYRSERNARAETPGDGVVTAERLLDALRVQLVAGGVPASEVDARLRPALAALVQDPASARALVETLASAGR